MSRMRFSLTPLLMLAAASPLHASSTIVPDSHPTVQQAIDSGVDTVYVKSGTYFESLVVSADLVLLAYEPDVVHGSQFDHPIIAGLKTTHDITVRGVRFLDLVTVAVAGGPLSAECVFEACRFDGGMSTGDPLEAFLYVRGCTFLADSDITPYSCQFMNNAFIGAHLNVGYEGFASFHSNVFTGSGDHGLRVNANDGGCTIAGNLIRDKVTGLIIEDPVGTTVSDNEISDCSGTAIQASRIGVAPGSPVFDGNRISECGGHGIALADVGGAFYENVISDVGGDGIQALGFPLLAISVNQIRNTGGHGVHTDGSVNWVDYNVILNATGDGVVVESVSNCHFNVVGRAGGVGIRVTDGFDVDIQANTLYYCGGAGIELADGSPGLVEFNIAYQNGGVGFAWLSAGAPTLGCNDWYANTGGATSGVSPAGTDLAVDPLFCNVGDDDVRLSAGSPLVSVPSCGGPIGALGVGCAVPVSVRPADPGGLDLQVYPQPARGLVTFAWGNTAEPARIEVYDLTGARRWTSDIVAGSQSIEWGFHDASGRALAPGVYLVRLERGRHALTRKITLTR